MLPEVAHQLLILRNNQNAGVTDLVEVIARDPVISAQILRYGRMSIFGYGRHIRSLQDAITLVLGYEKALHMALGISAGQSLKIISSAPLGGKAFWENAIYMAMLTQALAKQLPTDRQPIIGLCYLSGLMHEIGLLLLAHLYPVEFSLLNTSVVKHYDQDLREVELQCLGISHDLSGVALLQAWELPEEIIVAVGEYSFPDYDGKHAIYAKLVYLAKQLHKLSPKSINEIRRLPSLVMFKEIGIDEEGINKALKDVMNVYTEMTDMAEALVA